MKQLVLCDAGNIKAIAPLCKAGGYGIEVQLFIVPAFLDNTMVINSHIIEAAGISSRSFHSPFGDLVPGSFDEMVRKTARTRFEQGFKVAMMLEAQHIIHHHNGMTKYMHTPGEWIKRSRSFWTSYLGDKPENVHFHLENFWDHEPGIILELVQAIDRPNLDICLDIGHANCFSKVPVLKWVEALGRHIGYVHMNGNHGEEDEHLALDKGTIPVDDVCHALLEYAPDAIWALEVGQPQWTVESLDWLRNKDLLK